MGYGICISKKIEAAHFLTSYNGAPEPVHGHTWKIEVFIEGELNEEEYVVDFVVLEKFFDKINSEINHNSFNNHPYFHDQRISPTAENICFFYYKVFNSYILDQIKNNKIAQSIKVTKVHVWEGPDHFAFYSR